jgi:hypothetical protein
MAENDGGDYRITWAEQIFGKAANIVKGNPPEPHEPNVPPAAAPGSAVTRTNGLMTSLGNRTGCGFIL